MSSFYKIFNLPHCFCTTCNDSNLPSR